MATGHGSISSTILWSAVCGVIYLPAMSYTGYSWSSGEYLTGAAMAGLSGLVCSRLARIRSVGALLLGCLVIGGALLYFGHLLRSGIPSALALSLGALAFAVLCWFRVSAALTVAGYAAMAQIVVTAFQTPPLLRTSDNPDVASSDLPAIFHLVLDEHAATGAFPDDIIPPEDIRKLEQDYVSMGFTVFRHAYSVDGYTWQSMTRILNPHTEDPESLVKKGRTRFTAKEGALLDRARATRSLDLTYNSFYLLDEIPDTDRSVSRMTMYDILISAVPLAPDTLSIESRAIIAVALVQRWFKINSPAFQRLIRTRIGAALSEKLDPPSRTQALISKAVLDDFIERMDCCETRGTYYFSHLIWPHYPYVHRRDCSVRPATEWLKNWVGSKAISTNTLDSRRERYLLYFEQTTCLAIRMKAMIAAIDDDAIVLLHSDHGSRISIDDRTGIAKSDYDDVTYQTDWYGAFAALRMPGVLQPGVVEDPVAIDALLRQLSDNDFSEFDLKSISSSSRSPYRR